MSRTFRAAIAVLGLVMSGVGAFGQSETIEIRATSIYYQPYYGDAGYGAQEGPLTLEAFGNRVCYEGDYVTITIDAFVPDTDADTAIDEVELYYGKESLGLVTDPACPPVDADSVAHWANEGDQEAVTGAFTAASITSSPSTGVFRFNISFELPEINGVNQDRLRGTINYDIGYDVTVWVWNSETAGETVPPFVTFYQWVVENPNLRPDNDPPAYADAGPDLLAAVGDTVELDAQRTFDGFNVGFDYLNPDVLDKDTLTFNWEWLSGPVQVNPVIPDPDSHPWLAEVTFTTVGTYVYRVYVSDGVNPVSYSDTATIEVLTTLPVNHAPHAVIDAPTTPVVVGQTITLDGSGSYDIDGTALHYRWRQTDEVGDPLPFSMLATTFQPMGGVQAPVSQWQAITPGTYYFMLLVDDLRLTDSATTSVTVVAAANAGETVTANKPAESLNAVSAISGAGCGAGLTPLLLAPLALLLLRGRMR